MGVSEGVCASVLDELVREDSMCGGLSFKSNILTIMDSI